MKIEPWGTCVGMDGGRYNWQRREFRVDRPGINTFSMWMREDGAIVDRLLFTADAKYEPEPLKRGPSPGKAFIGEGPDESPMVSVKEIGSP
jgi:hypothetical protein